MDEFDAIRSFRRSDVSVNPAARSAARDRLLEHIAADRLGADFPEHTPGIDRAQSVCEQPSRSTRVPDIARWLWLVEQHVGVGHEAAVRGDRLAEVERLLRDFRVRPTSPEQQVAQATVELARDVYRLRPLSWWLTRRQAVVAAATAVEELRILGWAPEAGADQTLAKLLQNEGTGRDRTASLRMLSLILSAGGAPANAAARDAGVYLSVPFSSRGVTQAGWPSDIEEVLDQVGASCDVRLLLCAPELLGERNLGSLSSGLQRSVLHLVLGGRGTLGVGRELQSSISRRRPVVWFVPPGQAAPPSVRAAALEADVEIVHFASSQELRAQVRDVVQGKLPTMLDLLKETNSVPLGIIKLQSELRRRWMRASPEVLANTRIGAERANLLLMDSAVLYHEASFSELDAFSAALGIDVFGVMIEGGWHARGTRPTVPSM